MSALIQARNLSKTYGTRRLFGGVSISAAPGECVGMIGPNGSGKSTLLKALAGVETPDSGEITLRRGLRIGYVPQADSFAPGAVASEVVAAAIETPSLDPHERQVRAETLLERIGFADVHAAAGTLSGGWRKRLAIARQLVREPDLLLLDEPTNHLDLEGILWLEDLLADERKTSVVITHDRYFLEEVATRVVELSAAYPDGVLSVEGPYSEFLRRRAEFLNSQARQQQALESKVRQDLVWLGRGAQARRTKAKGRIQDAAQRMEELATVRRRNAPARAAGIDFAATGRQTRDLIAAHGLSKSLGGRPLFRGLDLVLRPGMRLGLLGPNGSGKTTLLRVLSGDLPPDAGSIKRADGLRVVLFDQHRAEIDPRITLHEALCPVSDTVFHRGQALHVVTWAQRFLFRKEQLAVSAGDLSGGEQARIQIARLMLEPADVLILDEPTNDLDIASLEVLEQSIEEFPGAVLLVTHDRFMLQRLSTDVLGLDGEGGARMFADYSQWQAAQREARPPEPAKKPTPSATSPEPTGPGSAVKSKKLSYNEQREYDGIELKITRAEERVRELEGRLAEPSVIADHRAMQQCCGELDEAQREVAKLYERWTELESRRG